MSAEAAAAKQACSPSTTRILRPTPNKATVKTSARQPIANQRCRDQRRRIGFGADAISEGQSRYASARCPVPVNFTSSWLYRRSSYRSPRKDGAAPTWRWRSCRSSLARTARSQGGHTRSAPTAATTKAARSLKPLKYEKEPDCSFCAQARPGWALSIASTGRLRRRVCSSSPDGIFGKFLPSDVGDLQARWVVGLAKPGLRATIG
jgi:hypothetical protein